MRAQLDILQNLLFRREFLISPSEFNPTGRWTNYKLPENMFLSVHPDIEVVTTSCGEIYLTIIGVAIHPYHPNWNLQDIAETLLETGTDINDIIDLSKPLTGRWVIIYFDGHNTYIFNDPCAFRSVFYCHDNGFTWCGSQPEIIKTCKQLALCNQDDLVEFITSTNFSHRESAWVGTKTIYSNIFHLLPNHYLNLSTGIRSRFFPSPKVNHYSESMIVETSAKLLQGSIEGITNKTKAIQALTAGWDSRVLLAASRNYSQKIEYFVDRMGILGKNHPDVLIPKILSRKIGLEFFVRDSRIDPPGWFVSLLSNNVTGARVLPKTRIFYNHYLLQEDRININGNGSEICRNFYNKYLSETNPKVTSASLSKIMGYADLRYVENEINDWLKGIPIQNNNPIDLFDLLYWEQRLGNWGAQYPSEQDIAIDEFSPFNCRLLLETLLQAPKEMRSAPNFGLYTELIRSMWPELLSVPIISEPSFLRYFKNRLKHIAHFQK